MSTHSVGNLIFDAEAKTCFYRIGWNRSPEGNVEGWTQPFSVAAGFGPKAFGAGCALGDLSGTGRKDLVVFYLEEEGDEARGRYVVGKRLSSDGALAPEAWTAPRTVPGWFGDHILGADVALADISRTGRQDLVVFHLNKNDKRTTGHYRIGWELDANGEATGDWGDILDVPGEYADDVQGAGLAIADIKRAGKTDRVWMR